MPTIAAISRERHGTKRWKRYTSYKFTAGDPSASPIFIVGMPRSGTSLVEQILGRWQPLAN